MKKVIKIVALTLSAIFTVGNVWAVTPVGEGNQISGHVIEAESEFSIPGASVLIIELNKGAVADENGQFSFKNIEVGKYTIKVTAMGYKAMEKQVTVSKDFVAVVHFPLQEETLTKLKRK